MTYILIGRNDSANDKAADPDTVATGSQLGRQILRDVLDGIFGGQR